MFTNAAVIMPARGSEYFLSGFADRWFWFFMAILFLSLILAGFIPNSILRIQAIQSQQSPPFPWYLHIHAVAMGSWMLLLLTQTFLMGTRQRKLHMSLGLVSLVVAPLVFTLMVVMTVRILMQLDAAPADTPLAIISGSRGNAFVLTVQGRAIILFGIFFVWAFRTRLKRPDTHKRMMFLATWALIAAGIARITGSNELGAMIGLRKIGLTSMDYISHVWQLMALLPALIYDYIRFGKIHNAWLAGIALFLPFPVAAHFLEAAPPWWQDFVGEMMGRV